jgi:raffinose/stachyose/melibiose transport system permease protein
MSEITVKQRKDHNLKKHHKNVGINGKNNIGGYLFILPLLIIFVVFLLFSFYFLIKNSFYRVTISFLNPKYVGLNNYKAVFGDPEFFTALINTFLIAVASIFAGLTFGFIISVFLGFAFKGKKFFQSIFFIPAMLPIAMVAAVFGSMLEYRDGALNSFLRFFGLGGFAQRWLVDPKLAMMSVMSVSIYLVGIPIMYYTADLATLNTSIFEAAIIDGAGLKDMMVSILFPLLKNTHKTITLSMFLGSFREMERVYMMTNGGPGGSTQIIGTYIFTGARSPGSNLGIVSAASVIIMIIAFIIAFLQLRMYGKSTTS